MYEYVPGGDLHDLLLAYGGEEDQGLPAPLALEVMQDIVEPLAYTHQRGLVHRDLKPANILVRSRSRDLSQIGGHNSIKLTDFGIGGVAVVNSIDQKSQVYIDSGRLSSTDQVNMLRGSGTPLYMSEEQARGDPPDPRHDIYSLGVIWYQLLVGNPSVRMGPAWEQRLERKNAPQSHIDIIKRCVGIFETRPINAGQLLEMMPSTSIDAPPVSRTPQRPPPRKFCISCGTETRPNIRFCHGCGRPL